MSRLRSIALGLAAAAIVVLTSAVPAAAHDELIASDPVPGQELDAGPTAVTLEFSADLLDQGAMVILADGDGQDWIEGDVEVDGAHVSVAVRPGMPAGGYEVRWRVVSSDGHPIAGVIPFTVGEAAALPPVTPTPTALEEPVDTNDENAQESQDTQESRGVLRAVLIGAGGAVFAVALVTGILFLRRRGSADDGSDDRSDETDPATSERTSL